MLFSSLHTEILDSRCSIICMVQRSVTLHPDIATVSEGQLYVPGTRRLPFGALSVSRYLAERLQQRGVPVPDPAALDVLRDTIVRVADTAEEAQALMSKVTQQQVLP